MHHEAPMLLCQTAEHRLGVIIRLNFFINNTGLIKIITDKKKCRMKMMDIGEANKHGLINGVCLS